MPKSSYPSTAASIFGSDRAAMAPRPADLGARAYTTLRADSGAAAGMSAAAASRGDSGARAAGGGAGTDSNWFLVKCLPLEMDDYHRGASQVLQQSMRAHTHALQCVCVNAVRV